MDVSPNCDCHAENDVPILPNIGMFASTDPLALDQACVDACMAAEPMPGSQLAKHLADPEFHDQLPLFHHILISSYSRVPKPIFSAWARQLRHSDSGVELVKWSWWSWNSGSARDGLTVSVHDSCSFRQKPQVHAAVRNILRKMNIKVVDSELSGTNSRSSASIGSTSSGG